MAGAEDKVIGAGVKELSWGGNVGRILSMNIEITKVILPWILNGY